MRFAPTVHLFCINDVLMIGNSANGCTIGLTKDAFAICHELRDSDRAAESIKGFDKNLFDAMLRNCFFGETKTAPNNRSAYLHITERCQLSCQGCYARAENRTLVSDPALSDLHKALDFLKKNNVGNLIIAGGEPLIRDDFRELLHLIGRYSFSKVVLLTNGLLLEKWQSDLAGYVDVVSISVDACGGNLVSYARNCNCIESLDDVIELLRNSGIAVQLLVTVHAKNVCEIANFAAYGAGKDIPVSYSLLSKTPGLSNQSELFLSAHELPTLSNWLCDDAGVDISEIPLGANLVTRDSCGAGRTVVSVAANGNVYPCHMLHNTDFIVGNAFCDLDLMLSEGGACADLINYHGSSVSECANCRYLPLCGSGCRARALAESDTIYAPDPFCNLIQDYYQRVFSGVKARLKCKE